VQAGNTGPGSGHNTITESVTTYNPTGLSETENDIEFMLYPNPAKDFIALFISPAAINDNRVTLVNAVGQKVFEQNMVQPAITYYFDTSKLEAGIYYLTVRNGSIVTSRKVSVVK
jgi:hypothetical protein